MLAQLRPCCQCPTAAPHPSGPHPREPAIRSVPSTPTATQTDRRPRRGTLLLHEANLLFRTGGTSHMVPGAAPQHLAGTILCLARGGEEQQGRGDGCFRASLLSDGSGLVFGCGSCPDVAISSSSSQGAGKREEGSGHQQSPEEGGIPFAPSRLSPYFWCFWDDLRCVFFWGLRRSPRAELPKGDPGWDLGFRVSKAA